MNCKTLRTSTIELKHTNTHYQKCKHNMAAAILTLLIFSMLSGEVKQKLADREAWLSKYTISPIFIMQILVYTARTPTCCGWSTGWRCASWMRFETADATSASRPRGPDQCCAGTVKEKPNRATANDTLSLLPPLSCWISLFWSFLMLK